MDDVVALFHDVAASVPAYPKFLGEHGVDPGAVRTLTDFRALPMTSKATYQSRYPLPELCRDGRIGDMIAVSSGSSGTPTVWPRSTSDELHITARFEQVFREFGADRRSTLAIVCFPLGTWVGGLFTLACVRHLATRGFPVTTVAPGNNKAEILRVFPELAPHFDQVVLLGYPPFVKDVIDSGTGWADHDMKMVFAGEVFSEEWRDLVASRGGVRDPVRGMASLYGTADAGVLGNETPQSVSIRRFLAGKPDLARELFGDSRLPTLVQYDPASRFFEVHNGTLLFSGDNGVPLIRYHIADEGGVITHQDMLEFCSRNGFTPTDGPELPFVFVFGRSLFTVSFFGANVYPENVTVGLEQPGISDWVTVTSIDSTGSVLNARPVLIDRKRAERDQPKWHAALAVVHNSVACRHDFLMCLVDQLSWSCVTWRGDLQRYGNSRSLCRVRCSRRSSTPARPRWP
jgi:phenylacetate-CoA ligase